MVFFWLLFIVVVVINVLKLRTDSKISKQLKTIFISFLGVITLLYMTGMNYFFLFEVKNYVLIHLSIVLLSLLTIWIINSVEVSPEWLKIYNKRTFIWIVAQLLIVAGATSLFTWADIPFQQAIFSMIGLCNLVNLVVLIFIFKEKIF